MLNGIRIEICAGSIEDVKIASSFQEVDRIELNSHLEKDGLTPDQEVFLKAKDISDKAILPMVRLSEGPFIADHAGKLKMLQQAEYFLKHGAAGIVFGILNQDGTLDEEFTRQMSDLVHSYHSKAVFHKAFDVCKDKDVLIKQLIRLHVDRILTSGGFSSSKDGEKVIASYNEKYGEEIQFQPAGGVNGSNVVEILKETGCTRFHMSLRSATESPEEKVSHALREVHLMKVDVHQSVLTGEDKAMLEDDPYENSFTDSEDTHDQM